MHNLYLILEVANTHGGDKKYIYSLLDEYKILKKNVGIKFQPLRHDKIACSDYHWYEVYKELYFDPKQWGEIIEEAGKTKDVWLDIFDEYGIEILKNNHEKIKGIKLQSSILKNQNIFNQLCEIDLSRQFVILNISGYELNEIKELVNFYENSLRINELLIEVGFQSYPTEFEDSGISKIKILRENLTNKIVFADHANGQSEDAIDLPLFAFNLGVNFIEKHVMHSTLETKYDYHSSVTFDRLFFIYNKLLKYSNILENVFINDREIDYFNKTVQLPVLADQGKQNERISLKLINFKRTNQKGINYNQLLEKFHLGFVKLKTNHKKDTTFNVRSFKKVNIGCIIAARLKSSRLKRKAALKIGNLTSIELCLKNCLSFENVDKVILATSFLKEDKDLEKLKYSNDVIFRQGEPINVIKRYLDIIEEFEIETFVRVTGDMPFVSKEVFKFLLEKHFESGADYTVAREASVGINLEIINSEALKKVNEYFPNAEYSEYMTWYFQNNPDYFKLNFVDLPKNWIRNYRLTLDYQKDLKMFNKIQSYFDNNKVQFTIENLNKFLDKNPEISSLNQNMKLKYKSDTNLIKVLNQKTKI